MKIFAYNNDLNKSSEFGSFTVVARKLNKEFARLNILGDVNDPDCAVIYPEVFETEQKWKKQIPYLACEYSLAPKIVIDKLKSYNPLVLAISDFAKNNIINSGYSKVEAVHLGVDIDTWYPTLEKNKDIFTYLTVNTSNERSGLEKLVKAFDRFSKNKNVQLIIKDGKNLPFGNYVNSFNNNKIKYISEIMSEENLRDLYSQSNLFLYTNNTTSFGMTPLEAVLCGTPAIVTLGSALKEFIPEWTQPYKIYTEFKLLDKSSIQEWASCNISCFPEYFLNLFEGPIYGERVDELDIYNALEFSFENYKKYVSIVSSHKEEIIKNFTFEQTALNILKILKKYDYIKS
jgi:glycosyltransferase involved in cell wall biosynthesis